MTDTGRKDDERAAGAADRAGRAGETARRRREFIRAHHPDRGGDTERFITGLRGFDDDRTTADPGAGDGPLPRVTITPHRPWPTRLVTAAVRRLRPGSAPARVR